MPRSLWIISPPYKHKSTATAPHTLQLGAREHCYLLLFNYLAIPQHENLLGKHHIPHNWALENTDIQCPSSVCYTAAHNFCRHRISYNWVFANTAIYRTHVQIFYTCTAYRATGRSETFLFIELQLTTWLYPSRQIHYTGTTYRTTGCSKTPMLIALQLFCYTLARKSTAQAPHIVQLGAIHRMCRSTAHAPHTV